MGLDHMSPYITADYLALCSCSATIVSTGRTLKAVHHLTLDLHHSPPASLPPDPTGA